MIGKRLTKLRVKRGMTQKGLAQILNVTPSAVSGYETGRNSPSDEIKCKIAELFEISLDYLLGLTDEEVSLNRENVVVLDKEVNFEVRENLRMFAHIMDKGDSDNKTHKKE